MFYHESQNILKDKFFFKMVCDSFEMPLVRFDGGGALEFPHDHIADYVYGQIPMGDVRNCTPAYTSSVYGPTDTIIVSVVTGKEAEQFCRHMFMERIIEQMIGLRSLEHVSSLPIFKEWAKAIA